MKPPLNQGASHTLQVDGSRAVAWISPFMARKYLGSGQKPVLFKDPYFKVIPKSSPKPCIPQKAYSLLG